MNKILKEMAYRVLLFLILAMITLMWIPLCMGLSSLVMMVAYIVLWVLRAPQKAIIIAEVGIEMRIRWQRMLEILEQQWVDLFKLKSGL